MSRFLAPMLSLVWVSIGFFVFLFALFNPDAFPESIPVHWNIEGVADRHVPKSGLFGNLVLFPAMMTGIVIIALALPLISPKSYMISISQPAVGWIFCLILLLFLVLQVTLTLAMAEKLEGHLMSKILFGMIGLFFAGMGPFLANIPRNFYVGIKTPWTLASDEVWRKTHLMGAWTFTIGGLLSTLCSLFLANFWIMIGIIIIASLTPVVYSFWLSKRLERASSSP